MDRYKVLVPNLERREDRWLVCAGVLLGQGVPKAQIERFYAHDGANYRDSQDIAHEANEQYGFSRFIHGTGEYITTFHEGWDPYNYSYCRTYYDAWNRVACEPDHAPPTLILQDDWMMLMGYEEIAQHVRGLYLAEDEFCMLQYVGKTCDPDDAVALHHRRTAIDNVQHGLAGTGDQALLLSPKGAKGLVEFADANPTHAPEVLLYHFSRAGDNSGCYSVVENQGNHLGNNFYAQFQDRSTPHGGVTTEWKPEDISE